MSLINLMFVHLFRFCQTVEVKTVPESAHVPREGEEEEAAVTRVPRPPPSVPVKTVAMLALVFGILVSKKDML